MYVTRSFNKRAIQCFVPRPVWPALTPDIRRLAILDAAIACSDEVHGVADVVGSIVMAREETGAKMPGVESAVRYLSGVQELTSSTVRRVNSHIVGSGSACYRPGFIWTGGNSAAETWHAGSPADQLPPLMNGLLAGLGRPGWPASAAALVVAIRILQIHPFSDGNGRTARTMFWQVISRQFGPRALTLAVLEGLWARARFDIHSASNDVRDRGDWSALVDRCLATALK